MNERKTTNEVAATRPNTARQMEESGLVAEITYEYQGGYFQKMERADGTSTTPIRVA